MSLSLALSVNGLLVQQPVIEFFITSAYTAQ
jgi:hypothetical protein